MDEFYLIFFSTNSDGRIPGSINYQLNKKKRILFYLLDEAGSTANELSDNYHCIFKQYLPYEMNNNIFPFPLGRVNEVQFENDEIKPINERAVNAFFSGSLNKNRTDFFNQFNTIKIPSTKTVTKVINFPIIRRGKRVIRKILNKFNKKEGILPDSFINFTNGFKQGLPRKDYIQYLLSSKIAFCPGGASSIESYRHYEAMSAGCVIISDKLPKTSIYEGSPIIQVENWEKGIEVARNLLNQPKELERLQEATLKFWEKHYSSEAVAKYIIEKINSIKE